MNYPKQPMTFPKGCGFRVWCSTLELVDLGAKIPVPGALARAEPARRRPSGVRQYLPGAMQRHERLVVTGNNLSGKSRVPHWTIAGEEGGATREGSNGRGHQGEARTSLSAPARGGGGARSRSSLRGGSGRFRRRRIRPLLHRWVFRVPGNVSR